MIGRVVDFSKSEHQKTLEVLPWFVNATLEPMERAAAEQHLAECASCRRELEAVRTLADAYRASEMPLDADRALDRLRPRLVPQQRPDSNVAARPRRFRLKALVGFTLAAQFGIIVALGWTLVVMLPAVPTYVALGAANVPLRAQGDAIVVFSPGVEVGAMQRALASVGARIVDGPTVNGGYVIRIDGRDLDSAVADLRANPSVRMVARLDQAPRQ